MREADIRPADLLEEYLRLSAEDAKAMLTNDAGFQERACPGCLSSSSRKAFKKSGFTFVRCENCDSLFANPVPSESILQEFYQDSVSSAYWSENFFPAVAEARRKNIFEPRVANILELTQSLGIKVERLIDVGAGAGIFIQEVAKASRKISVRAIEPNNQLATRCRDAGFETFMGFAEDASESPDWHKSADLVTCFEVIEHVVYPDQLLKNMKELATKDGVILVTGLCGDGYDIVSLGHHANSVSPPHHLTFLSRRGVHLLLDRCGLDLIHFSTPGVLDVEIVSNALRDNPTLDVGPFVKWISSYAPEDTKGGFQTFLSNYCLSSHMWIAARCC